MAKKIPPPLVRHDPDQTGQRNDQRPDQSGDQYGSHRNYEAEDHEGDTGELLLVDLMFLSFKFQDYFLELLKIIFFK